MNEQDVTLTREQYKQMLKETRAKGREKLYLMIKVFALLGVTVQNLDRLTLEAVQKGSFDQIIRGSAETIQIPGFLREELSAYAHRQGITTGPLFRGSENKAMTRNAASVTIARLGDELGFPDGAATPTNLARLSKTAMEDVKKDFEDLYWNEYWKRYKEEQSEIGWDM